MRRTKLSIIIPSLNEEDHIGDCLNSIKQRCQGAEEIEVLLVDSGSTDRSLSIAKKAGCRVFSPKIEGLNKALALNFAAKQAKGDALFFLDADSIPPPQFDLHIYKTLEDSRIVGGAFRFCFKEKSPGLRFVEIINRIRYTLWKTYYGDQGIFVRRRVFEKLGGYPPCSILEASKLCEKLKKEGRLKLIPLCMYTSARRFLEGGTCRVFLHDARIWFYDTIGLDTEHFGAPYWSYNLKRNSRRSDRN